MGVSSIWVGSLAAMILASETSAQNVMPRGTHPITGPVHRIEGMLNAETGEFRRRRGIELGSSGLVEVYDNTCRRNSYTILQPGGPGGTGGSFSQSVGDFGAVPRASYGGSASCTPGCALEYEIASFEIAWCQFDAPVTGAVILVDVWNPPWGVCGDPIGGVRPPASPTVFSTTLSGLPRTNSIGLLTCYSLNVDVEPPFTLGGSDQLVPGPSSDHFAWAFTIPTTTGDAGPVLAGDLSPQGCAPCEGTLWEVGGQSSNQGTGAGQYPGLFLETYGGTIGTGIPGGCFLFGGPAPTGLYLELFAADPCPVDSTRLCNASDGATSSCPCGAGFATAGCDSPIPPMQGGGLTGGVTLTAVAQSTVSANRATVVAGGFPTDSKPGAVLLRNAALATGGPLVFGDGVSCIDPAGSVRIGGARAFGGVFEDTIGHGTGDGSGTFFYQLWYRSTPASYCDASAAFNLSNGVTLTW